MKHALPFLFLVPGLVLLAYAASWLPGQDGLESVIGGTIAIAGAAFVVMAIRAGRTAYSARRAIAIGVGIIVGTALLWVAVIDGPHMLNHLLFGSCSGNGPP